MRRLFWTPLIAVALFLPGCNRNSPAEENDDLLAFNGYLPVVKDGKLGFIDASGHVAIQPQFELTAGQVLDGEHFEEGLEPLRVGDQWGFIGTDGKFRINPQFDEAQGFSDGLAPVRIKDRWGYVDPSGKLIINPQFDAALPFRSGRAAVRVGAKWGFIDHSGKFVVNPQFDAAFPFVGHFAGVLVGNKWGFINESGQFAVNPQFDGTTNFFGDLATVQVGDKYGFVNRKGFLTVNPQFLYAAVFRGRLARVRMGDRFGFVDATGKLMINPQFDEATDFSEGLAAVGVDGRWGYVDTEGKYVINPQFEAASAFRGGIAPVTAGGRIGFIDRTGHYVVNPQFDHVGARPIGSYWLVQADDKLGYIDNKGRFVWPMTPVLSGDTAGERSEPQFPTMGDVALQSALEAGLRQRSARREQRLRERVLALIPEHLRSGHGDIGVVSYGSQAAFELVPNEARHIGIIVPANQGVTISAHSTSFDTFLRVAEVQGGTFVQVAENDDYGGSDSSVTLCGGTGLRVVTVTSYAQGRGGPFTLSVGPNSAGNGCFGSGTVFTTTDSTAVVTDTIAATPAPMAAPVAAPMADTVVRARP
jgi:hypothetical protein